MPDPAPLPPETDSGFWARSATKAAIVSSVMGLFALARGIRTGHGDAWALVIDYTEATAQTWLSAWLGIAAAGTSRPGSR